jgi:hypothetical protein
LQKKQYDVHNEEGEEEGEDLVYNRQIFGRPRQTNSSILFSKFITMLKIDGKGRGRCAGQCSF